MIARTKPKSTTHTQKKAKITTDEKRKFARIHRACVSQATKCERISILLKEKARVDDETETLAEPLNSR